MQAIIEKAKAIRLFILDVDGVLTSGLVYYGNQDETIRGFHLHDGLGIKLLLKSGVNVAVISGKNSAPVSRRIQELGIQHAYLGCDEKLSAYEKLKQKLQLADHEIAHMGDDLPDLPLLRRVGLAITVPKAPAIIRQHVDLITINHGGDGAVREACEFIMTAQDQFQSMVQSYLL